MFGFLNRLRGPETRSAEIDLGALYQSVFAFSGGSYSWSQSPAILVSSLGVLDNAGALLTQSRRLGRQSPLLIAYRAVIETGVLTGEAEAPEYDDAVPEAVADLWTDAHNVDRERALLDRLVLDGEFLILDDDTVIPPDGFEPIMAGPKWNREVIGYKIGMSPSARMAGLRYVGDRPMGASRALPWIAPALPPAAGLLNARTGAAHALGSHGEDSQRHLERELARPDHRERRACAAGLVDQAGTAEPERQPISSASVGAVPYLRIGEEVKRIANRPGRNGEEI